MKTLLVLAAISVTLSGCGSSGTGSRPASGGGAAKAPSSAVAVVRAWARELGSGHLDAAAGYFAVPATVQNGTPALRLGTRKLVRAFNASLPCGAQFVKAQSIGRYTVVTFRLTERPGGSCGAGTGGLAATAFAIRDSKIAEWRRAAVPGASVAPPAPAQPAPRGGGLST